MTPRKVNNEDACLILARLERVTGQTFSGDNVGAALGMARRQANGNMQKARATAHVEADHDGEPAVKGSTKLKEDKTTPSADSNDAGAREKMKGTAKSNTQGDTTGSIDQANKGSRKRKHMEASNGDDGNARAGFGQRGSSGDSDGTDHPAKKVISKKSQVTNGEALEPVKEEEEVA